ncbi:lytic polysaccharide monooxygenase [Echria macrotheca]|uniref:lytic cellulose monooxygenase (C4-dehydrogenating) n=1 Tax=Echria macrotheca TaxID=438768 RepID=A0AAJ0F7N4_9PEZI|nr:lytic polysaccharide monooxygenase [Echria macrotheca]
MRAEATAAIVLASVGLVSAHGWIDIWTIGGKNYTGFNPTAAPWVPDQGTAAWPAWNDDTGPVYSKNVNTPDIICSINATNAKISTQPIAAGSTVDLHWTAWPDSHHGPILSYLAPCNGDCTQTDKTTLKWFKIEQAGQISLGVGGGKAGYWAADKLRDNNGAWTVAIPSSIKPGNYVLRNEIIALHSAYDVGAAQFYPQCVNVQITGGGAESPPGVVGTELYTPTDAGVHYNIYNDEAKPVYQFPGPPLCKS